MNGLAVMIMFVTAVGCLTSVILYKLQHMHELEKARLRTHTDPLPFLDLEQRVRSLELQVKAMQLPAASQIGVEHVLASSSQKLAADVHNASQTVKTDHAR